MDCKHPITESALFQHGLASIPLPPPTSIQLENMYTATQLDNMITEVKLPLISVRVLEGEGDSDSA